MPGNLLLWSAVFCHRILDAQKPPESAPQISVEEALERLSKGKQ